MEAVLLKADGTSMQVQPANGTDFTLAELYKLIECTCIEILPLYNGKLMIIDDEGKCKEGFVVNRFATELYHYGQRKLTEQEIKEHYKSILGENFYILDLAKVKGIPEELADAIVGNALVCERSMIK